MTYCVPHLTTLMNISVYPSLTMWGRPRPSPVSPCGADVDHPQSRHVGQISTIPSLTMWGRPRPSPVSPCGANLWCPPDWQPPITLLHTPPFSLLYRGTKSLYQDSFQEVSPEKRKELFSCTVTPPPFETMTTGVGTREMLEATPNMYKTTYHSQSEAATLLT